MIVAILDNAADETPARCFRTCNQTKLYKSILARVDGLQPRNLRPDPFQPPIEMMLFRLGLQRRIGLKGWFIASINPWKYSGAPYTGDGFFTSRSTSVLRSPCTTNTHWATW